MAAIAFPLLSTIATKIALGWIFLVAGVVLVVHAFSIQGWRGFLLGLLVGALYVVAGGWLAFFPFTGIITLTLLLAALFLAEGVLEVMHGDAGAPARGLGLAAAQRPRRHRRRRDDRRRAAELRRLGHRPARPASTCSRPASSFVVLALAGRRAGTAHPSRHEAHGRSSCRGMRWEGRLDMSDKKSHAA